MKVALLCGGKGTRLGGLGRSTPKPLVSVAGRPIVEWILRHYARFGHTEAVLALGHLAEQFHRWALGDEGAPPSLLPRVDVAPSERLPYRLTLLDTGPQTDTGGRLHRMGPALGGETFAFTYGDGLCDVDLDALVRFHRAHGRAVTVTAIQPRSAFGVMDLDAEGKVRRFREKPRLDVWTNGGYFVCEPRVLEHTTPTCNFERDVLPGLAEQGEVIAYRHEGFWACMDTAKDRDELDATLRRADSPFRPLAGA